jgi:hypothetical protein
MRRPIATMLLALALLAPAASADPGVHVDPDTPAGKEYALPLDEARKEATGDSGGPAPPAGEEPEAAPLFGAGVDRARAKGQGRGNDREGGRGQDADQDEPDRRALAAGVGQPLDGEGGSPALTGGLIALALLAAGGLLALALRRGLGRT